jgi:hypothetical protein
VEVHFVGTTDGSRCYFTHALTHAASLLSWTW